MNADGADNNKRVDDMNILKIAAMLSAAIPATMAISASAAGSAAAEISADGEAPAVTNWTENFGETPLGSFIVGNPDAPIKLVEYASYTCGHCATFESNDAPILKAEKVANGSVSFEIRSLVRDPIDLIMASLARCGGKDKFFGNHQFLMAKQREFSGRAAQLTDPTIDLLRKQDWNGFLVAAYAEMKLGELMQEQSITDTQAKICLSDKAATENLLAVTDDAGPKYNIQGTPSFLINDKLSDAHNYLSLKPLLAAPTIEQEGQ
ncbi:thioredoxin domain-containing protein [Sphingorhabdus arenilitoris]|uniref:Thioredoxin domain-containing protein n=1 Tax=Sphingorhabdus arenilitoris TaxID=1490041 RepID=A0ABV8REH6_9SPHN